MNVCTSQVEYGALSCILWLHQTNLCKALIGYRYREAHACILALNIERREFQTCLLVAVLLKEIGGGRTVALIDIIALMARFCL